MAKADNAEVETIDLGSHVGKLPKPKEAKVSCDNIEVDPLNFRFDGTNNELSLNLTSLDELEEQVRADRQILRHIVLNRVTSTGVLTALVGGRRLRVAKRIKADKDAPADVLKAMDSIPAYIYDDLDDEQKLFIINDQDQKKFRFTEVMKLIFMLFDKGLKWHEVAARTYRQYGDLKGKATFINELDALAGDKKAWEKRLKTWLKGAFKECYETAFHIGAGIPTMLMLEAAEKDKLIITEANAPKGTDKAKLKPGPYVYLDGNQKRLDELTKAKENDKAAGKWDAFEGGPEFKALLEKFHKEDYEGQTSVQVKSISREKLKEVAKTAKSKLSEKLLNMAAGDKDVEWKNDDLTIALFEAKQLKFMQNSEMVKDENIKKALYMALVCDDFEKFKEFLNNVTSGA